MLYVLIISIINTDNENIQYFYNTGLFVIIIEPAHRGYYNKYIF